MNDIEIAIDRIKNDETILIDLLNEEGANIKLKQSGESIGSGRCIFHGGTNNKLHILKRTDGYHFKCQSKCKIYGDVFDLLENRKGLELIDSIKYINDRYKHCSSRAGNSAEYGKYCAHLRGYGRFPAYYQAHGLYH